MTALDVRPAASVAVPCTRRPGLLAWVAALLLGLVLVGGIVALGTAVDHRDVPQSLQPTVGLSRFDVQTSDECAPILPGYDQAACERDLPQSIAGLDARTKHASTFGIVHFWQRLVFVVACVLVLAASVVAFVGYLVAEQRSGGVR